MSELAAAAETAQARAAEPAPKRHVTAAAVGLVASFLHRERAHARLAPLNP
jgi:hypothetical protein